MIEEVRRAFPGEAVKSYLGGLHLFRLSDSEVRAIAGKISATGITRVITGHCTGDRAYSILESCLGGAMEQFHCGKVIGL